MPAKKRTPGKAPEAHCSPGGDYAVPLFLALESLTAPPVAAWIADALHYGLTSAADDLERERAFLLAIQAYRGLRTGVRAAQAFRDAAPGASDAGGANA
jgi:hypothetical protein